MDTINAYYQIGIGRPDQRFNFNVYSPAFRTEEEAVKWAEDNKSESEYHLLYSTTKLVKQLV